TVVEAAIAGETGAGAGRPPDEPTARATPVPAIAMAKTAKSQRHTPLDGAARSVATFLRQTTHVPSSARASPCWAQLSLTGPHHSRTGVRAQTPVPLARCR